MTLWNASVASRQIALGIGPPTATQGRYFVELIDRPDLLGYFKSLSRTQRLAIARNIGLHDDPALAKLLGILLADFDAEVRGELTKSLSVLSWSRPEAVSKELKNTGSFQRDGVFVALRSLGPQALPYVAARLGEPETRSGAATFLVASGAPAIPFLLHALERGDRDAKMASADALGRLRSKAAAPLLEGEYAESSSDEERMVYLGAISAIGDRRSLDMLTKALLDKRIDPGLRAQAAIGVGRIGGPRAARSLWPYLHDRDPELAAAVLTGLQLAGDDSLGAADHSMTDRLAVAAEVFTAKSDALIAEGLRGMDALIVPSALAARGRSSLATEIARSLARLDSENKGEAVDALAGALVSTEPGRSAARAFKDGATAAFVQRRLRLAPAPR